MRNAIGVRLFYEHLSEVLHAIAQQEPRGSFEFSRYINGPPGTAGTRIFMYIQATAMTASWMRNSIKQLTNQEELALNSRYYVQDRIFHIPMIDFSTPRFDELQLEKIRVFGEKLQASWLITDSGNSFHAYFGTLLGQSSWHAYLGELLLQTPPVYEGKPMPVDVRWVGHSMINGFSALRCSCRTSKYKHVPYYVMSEQSKSSAIDAQQDQSNAS